MSGKAKILGAVLAAVAAVLFFVLKHGTPVPQKDGSGGAVEDSVRSEIQKQFEGAASILNKDAPKKWMRRQLCSELMPAQDCS